MPSSSASVVQIPTTRAAVAADFRLTRRQDLAQDVLISDARHVCLAGGGRSGKTFLIVRQIILRALIEDGTFHAAFRFRRNAIEATLYNQTVPKVLDLCWPGLRQVLNFNNVDLSIGFPNGSWFFFGGLDDKERTEKILGSEFATLYFNECSQIPWFSRNTAVTRLAQRCKTLKLKAFYDLNPNARGSWVHRLFIDKINPETKQPLANPLNYAHFYLNPIDNIDNIDPEYLEELKALPERDQRRFLYGLYADDTVGQLWTEDMLALTRVLGHAGTLPDFLRVIVAVDPSGSRGPEDTRSDEIGITVQALGTDGHGYLLEDLTGKYRPEDWGRVAVDAYGRHNADRVVGEINFGGDMIRAIIHAQDTAIPYSEVHASRGKVVRAEPISALYDQGKLHHVGYFPELEDELQHFTMSGYTGQRSPNRADALIWGWTELFPALVKNSEDRVWTPPPVNTRAHSAAQYVRRVNRR